VSSSSGHGEQGALGAWLAVHHAVLRHGGALTGAALAAGGPEGLLRDPPAGLPAELRAALRRPDESAIAADLAWAEGAGRALIAAGDPRYPRRLLEIADPPALLYVVGDAEALGLPQIAIVGSRNPTPQGAENARALAAGLARAGLVVTSGLAWGIDAAAHRGALEAEGTTIAVAGAGPDVVYPRVHRALAERIAASGARVTEYRPGTPPRRFHFPRRNRLIAGLALGVLVIEAGVRSGALITARLAAEHGREVLAVPGSIHNPLARGCHRLIRDGAKLVEGVADVLVEVAPGLRQALEEEAGAAPAARGAPRARPDAASRRVLAALGHDPATADRLAQRCSLTAAAVSSILSALELEGRVRALPGGRYVRAEGSGASRSR